MRFADPDASAGSEVTGKKNSLEAENNGAPSDTEKDTNRFPASLIPIPDSYLTEAEQSRHLQDLYYDTYESFSYDEKPNTPKARRGVSALWL